MAFANALMLQVHFYSQAVSNTSVRIFHVSCQQVMHHGKANFFVQASWLSNVDTLKKLKSNWLLIPYRYAKFHLLVIIAV